jgi:hypothetical protein
MILYTETLFMEYFSHTVDGIVRDANVVLERNLSFFIFLEFSSMSLCLRIFNGLSDDDITNCNTM